MAHNILLLVFATIWSLGLSLPLQTDPLTFGLETFSSSEDDRRTVFDFIESANNDITVIDNGVILTEGDIKLETGRNAALCLDCKWKKSNNGIVYVPYTIASTYTDLEATLLKSALQEFSTVTCIQFINRTAESYYIQIVDQQGCWSRIGREWGGQVLSLDRKACIYYGVAQHEVMHALGFYHEHARYDRDNYVDIMWNFISPSNQGDFKTSQGNLLDLPYDYNSVMHYGRYTFTNTSGKPTIVPKPDPKVFIGQRDGLSNLDVMKINRFYNCSLCRTKLLGESGSLSSEDGSPVNSKDNCLWLLQVPSDKVKFQIDSFNCTSNKCRAEINVYDGVTTASPLLAKMRPGQPLPLLISSNTFMLVEYKRDKSFPSNFTASYKSVLYGATFTTDNGTVVSPKYPSFYPNNVQSTWIILAPDGYKVSLTFPLFETANSPTCSSDFLMVRDGGSLTSPILGTYCGSRSGLKLTSSGKMMLLQFTSNLTNKKGKFRANYSFVRATSQ